MGDSSLDMSTASLLSRSQRLDDSHHTTDNSSIFSSLPSLPSLPPIDFESRSSSLEKGSHDGSKHSSSSNNSSPSSPSSGARSPTASSSYSHSHSHSQEQQRHQDDNSTKRPSKRQLAWGHVQSFSYSFCRFMFRDNNLPLILNIVGHLLAARQLWGRSKVSVIRYTNIQQRSSFSPSSTARLSTSAVVTGATTVVTDQFRSIGVLHLALGLLAALALKERRLSTERTALWVLSVAAWSQMLVQGKAYLQSPSLYTLKAIQEWGVLNGLLTIITTVALRNTVRRTGRLF